MIAYFILLIFVLTFFAPLIPGLIEFPLSSIFRFFVIPVVFAFPWILFVYIFRERTINASEIMNKKGNLIPLRWRMLYSFNTLIILAFFIFPFISPPLAVFAAFVLAYRIVHRSENIWQKSQGARLGYTLILFILLAIVPIYLTLIWFQYFIAIAGIIFLSWWLLFDPMYFTSLCIVNALAIGSLLHLSYGTLDKSGRLQHTDSQKLWLIRFAEFAFFIIFWVVLNSRTSGPHWLCGNIREHQLCQLSLSGNYRDSLSCKICSWHRWKSEIVNHWYPVCCIISHR
jgi:hypothetical protein